MLAKKSRKIREIADTIRYELKLYLITIETQLCNTKQLLLRRVG